MESWQCGETGCGVIFEQRNGKYDILTAAHVVDGKTEFKTQVSLDNAKEIKREKYIVPYGEPTYDMAIKQRGYNRKQ